MASPLLAHVQWNAALEAAPRQGLSKEMSAALMSLAALYVPDFEAGLAQIRQAARREPLNPIHELRRALLWARFGDLAAATAVVDRLKENLPNVPVLDYLRALFALRAGMPEKARGITGSLETSHPDFVYGKFLRAESQIVQTSKPRTVEKHLVALPGGKEWESLWADLLVKLVLLHPQEGPALAQKYAEKKLAKDSPALALVERAMSWIRAPIADFTEFIGKEPVDSHSEALVLECLIDKLHLEKSEDAFKALDNLRRRYPERGALRRACDTFLTHLATELSGKGRQEEALRLVERCLHDQPQDTAYHLNRAAIFTLLREAGPYHDAWAALNSHQYRLALLGSFSPSSIAQIIKTHRLFAQQARGNTGSADRLARGVFRVLESETDDKPRVVTNVDEIASDPDLLRQWIYHTQAELVFRHALLRTGGGALLESEDRDQALDRAEALSMLSRSLRILVPEEGAALEDILVRLWQDLASAVRTRYETPKSKKPEIENSSEPETEGEQEDAGAITDPVQIAIEQLKEEHLITLADLCLVCFQWRPEYNQLWVAEELLTFARAEIAFFDEELLARVQKRYDAPFAVQVLSNQLRKAASEKGPITPEVKRRAVETCMADLLREMAWSTYNGHSGESKESAARALALVDRARAFNPADSNIELTAAKLLSLAEYYDECRHALDRFRRLVDPEDQKAIEQADKVDELLRERRKEGKVSQQRVRTQDLAQAVQGSEFRIKELEADLDRCPTVWRFYDELVKELAVAGRFDEAIQWADRSIAQCLSRADQMNARGLAIEARGMKTLAEANPQAARVYAAGAHEPARKALEAISAGQQLDYKLLYILGRCELALGLPDRARAYFQSAAQICDRQLHRTVLRGLSENIDTAYLAVARTAVNNALQDGAMEEALEEAAAVFSRLQSPEAWLADFARVYYTMALNRLGVASTLPPPVIKVRAEWQNRITEALAKPADADRALALAELAQELHPLSVRPAQVLAERTHALKRQIVTAEVLRQAGALLSDKKFADTLTMLDSKDPAIACEPRLMRIRVLALLGLGRFNEADISVEQIAGGGADVREFVAHYPALAFRSRIAVAQELLRGGKAADAEAVLRGAVAQTPKDAADLAYCRAFAAALEGYELRRNGQAAAAKSKFLKALEMIEPHRQERSSEQRHLLELYDRLEKEVEYAGR